jgi:hypothetical protein
VNERLTMAMSQPRFTPAPITVTDVLDDAPTEPAELLHPDVPADDADATPLLLHPPDEAETAEIDATWDDDEHTTAGTVDAGQWLLLRDAVREIGSLERLYRLAHDGQLRSREDVHGRIEVWVADSESYDAPTHALEVAAAPTEELLFGGLTSPEVGRVVAALIAPLVESHQSQVALARENGALNERLAALERQLLDMRTQALREVAVAENVGSTGGPGRSRSTVELVLIIQLVSIVVLLALGAGWMVARGL